jgi:hypothetical protein
MEYSGFTVMSKDFTTGRTIDYKEMVFVKFGNKVYVQMFSFLRDGVIMPFDELMKNQYLKRCYELSRVAIGKPNIDGYYGTDVPDKFENTDEKSVRRYQYIDTVYIVEDALTKSKEAKKGNTYQTLDIKRLKRMKVATADKIAEFYNRYGFAFDDENQEDGVATYTALVNNL